MIENDFNQKRKEHKMKKLAKNAKLADVIEKINEIVEHLESMPAPRDRGPKSERIMTDEDALRIISGDLKSKSHREAAETLKLSYGQIYSARNGYTFRKIFENAKNKK